MAVSAYRRKLLDKNIIGLFTNDFIGWILNNGVTC